MCPEVAPPRPSHSELWEQAEAHERKEDWMEMEAVLARAEELAPDFASYAYKRGYALTRLGEHGRAVQSLERCLRVDPAFAECHFFLAEALQAKNQMQEALGHYDRAIRADPSKAYFYPPYVEALIVVKEYGVAESVANEGLRRIPSTESARQHIYALHLLSFLVYQARDDRPQMIRALERARDADGDRHPEVLFNLGALHASAKPPDPRAHELLGQFYRRVCTGGGAKKFADQCETARVLMSKLPR
jgi:tetratricopeptide (TPR) repeat protein